MNNYENNKKTSTLISNLKSRSLLQVQINELEKKKMDTFKKLHPYAVDDELCYTGNYLYHGIRSKNCLEKLENIFKEKKIKAGNYVDGYIPYDDNCNDGEYVSLIEYPKESKLEYNKFIKENISLIISPECKAYKTIYLPYDLWLYTKKYFNLKNRYSYAQYEYQVKEFISLEYVKAVGIPYRSLIKYGKKEEADFYKSQIIKLLNKYDLDIKIVDTSLFNDILYEKEDTKIFKRSK